MLLQLVVAILVGILGTVVAERLGVDRTLSVVIGILVGIVVYVAVPL